MHGKAQREPALHSVVLDCKLVLLHNTRKSLPAAYWFSQSQYRTLPKIWVDFLYAAYPRAMISN